MLLLVIHALALRATLLQLLRIQVQIFTSFTARLDPQ
jgi:hypothetical protein